MSFPDVISEQSAWSIPAPLTPIIGRDRELTAVVDLLRQEETRLVTLTGPGGVGKTRLAMEVARQQGHRMRDGSVFVDLTATNDPSMVIALIAYALHLNVRDTRGLDERVARELQDRELLLILDNFEHVIAAGVDVVQLLRRCSGITVLVTSQMPLHVRGEYEIPVPPLAFPGEHVGKDVVRLEQVDAIRLFVQRARAVQPDFRLTSENAAQVAEICRRLDGLPLAIELAAARTKVFPVTSLHARLADRMALLTGGARDLPKRLQTMRNAMQWSYELLTPGEQAVFRALSIFQGSFSIDAAIAVSHGPDAPAVEQADGLMETLYSLLDKSILVSDISRQGEARFRMLETIREFGTEQALIAGEGTALARRHLQFYASTAPDELTLSGRDQARALDQIDEDLSNIRYALQTALNFGGDAASEGLVLASSMWRYWMSRGQFVTGRYWLEALLARTSGGDLMVRGLAENNLGNLIVELGDRDAAQACYQRAMELYEAVGYLDGVADELNNLGLIQLYGDDYAAARRSMEQSLAIRERTGDRTSIPTTLSNLGDISLFKGELEEGAKYHLEAYQIRAELGNARGIASSCYHLGIISILQLDWEGARVWFERGMRSADRIGDTYSRASLQVGFGLLLVHDREMAPAIERLRSALLTFRDMSAHRMVLETIFSIGYCGVPWGHDREAVELISAAMTLRRKYPMSSLRRQADWVDAFHVQLHKRLGEDAFARAQATGRRWTIEEAVKEALALLDAAAREAAEHEPAQRVPEAHRDPPLELPSLTGRQLEVLRLLALGRSDKEIADDLSISPRTAMTHVANILGKLNVNRRSAASSIAIRAGLIPESGADEDERTSKAGNP